jgi:hypothetical protein
MVSLNNGKTGEGIYHWVFLAISVAENVVQRAGNWKVTRAHARAHTHGYKGKVVPVLN